MERESKRGNDYGYESLAEEIITDILSRLPIESVMICKCVCKSWNSLLVNDNYFARLHLSKSKTNPHILIESRQDTTKRYLLNVDNCNVREIDMYPHVEDKASCSPMAIASHFDGLICISTCCFLSEGPVVIYNPLITGDYLCLPESSAEERIDCITLGFDNSTNKYKVVKIMHIERKIGCEVITIGKDTSWRRVDFPYEGSFVNCMGICHQGSIYLMAQDLDKRWILEFDISKEVFSVVSSPNSFNLAIHPVNRRVEMHSLGEYLKLTEREGRLVHIWRIVKQKSTGRSAIVGYRKMKMESPYAYADLGGFIYLKNNEDLLVLRTEGGFEPGRRSADGGRIRAPGSHFSIYRPTSKKKNRFKNMSNLQRMFVNAYRVRMWSFKPSLISIKVAMLNHS